MSLRVGVCSTEHVHAATYVERLRDLDGVEFVGATDDGAGGEGSNAASVGGEGATGVDAAFRAPEALFEAADAVVVCSDNASHGRWVRAAAAAGVAVLCEKPLATDVGEAAALAAACEDAGVVAGVCMPMRFSPLALELKAAYESGDVGDLRFVTGTNRGRMPGGWFVDPERAGGGATTDHTVHVVDLVRWITGREVAEVYAEVDSRLHGIPVEDVSVLSMVLDDGTPFTLDGSWSRPDEWDTWGDVTLELLGTDGVARFDTTDATLKLTRDGGDDAGVASVAYGDDPDAGLLRDFVNAVEAERDPRTTMRDAVPEVAVIEAAYASAERGEPVAVADVTGGDE